jgi:hypothetical protein
MRCNSYLPVSDERPLHAAIINSLFYFEILHYVKLSIEGESHLLIKINPEIIIKGSLWSMNDTNAD